MLAPPCIYLLPYQLYASIALTNFLHLIGSALSDGLLHTNEPEAKFRISFLVFLSLANGTHCGALGS